MTRKNSRLLILAQGKAPKLPLLKPLQKSELELNYAFTVCEHSSHEKLHRYTHHKVLTFRNSGQGKPMHTKISFKSIKNAPATRLSLTVVPKTEFCARC